MAEDPGKPVAVDRGSSSGSGVPVRRLGRDEVFAPGMRGVWEGLVRQLPCHDLGQTWTWNSLWWGAHASDREIFALIEEDRAGTVAVWPLCLRRKYGLRTVQPLGLDGIMRADYAIPLIRRGSESPAFRNLLGYLGGHRQDWDVVELQVPQWSGLLDPFLAELVLFSRKLGLHWEVALWDCAPVVELPGSFDEYLKGLGSKTRAHVRQYLRAAAASNCRLELTQGRGQASTLNALFELNSRRWPTFLAEESRRLFLTLNDGLGDQGSGLAFPALVREERVLATALCYHNSHRFFVHPAGIDHCEDLGFNAGSVMYALLIERLIGMGSKRLDFSPGLEEYKLRLGGRIEPVHGVRIWNNDGKMLFWRGYRKALAAKAVGRGRLSAWLRSK